MEISSELLCLFTADISSEDDDYVVELPRREIETGSVEPGKSYRVALISPDDDEEPEGEPSSGEGAPGEPQPPVEPGEIRYVEIEDIGKQGDGIARVERGWGSPGAPSPDEGSPSGSSSSSGEISATR